MEEHPIRTWGFITLFLLILLYKLFTRKHAVVDKYEYLEVLSFTEWKAGRDIRIELEELKGGYLRPVEVYYNLSLLEDEGWVEREITESEVGKLHKFRRKPGGRKIRDTDEKDPAHFGVLQLT